VRENGSARLDLFANETLYQLSYDPEPIAVQLPNLTRICKPRFLFFLLSPLFK